MNQHHIFAYKGRDAITDNLTAMLKQSAQQLIHPAIQVELEGLLAVHAHRLLQVQRQLYAMASSLSVKCSPASARFR